MKYTKIIRNKSEYDSFIYGPEFISPNITFINDNQKSLYQKKIGPFPFYLNLVCNSDYNPNYFIETHTYSANFNNSELYNSLFKQLTNYDGPPENLIVPEKFLRENPIYVNGHQITHIGNEGLGDKYGVPLYWSTLDDYPSNQYDSPHSVYHSISPIKIMCDVDVWKFPEKLILPIGQETEVLNGLSNYIHEIYGYNYDYNDIPINITENLYIDNDKIESFSLLIKNINGYEFHYLKFKGSTTNAYNLLHQKSNALFKNIIFPLQLTSNEGTGSVRNITPNEKTKSLITYLQHFHTIDDGIYNFEFGENDIFIEIDGIKFYNPLATYDKEAHKMNDNIVIYGQKWEGQIKLDGSISIWSMSID